MRCRNDGGEWSTFRIDPPAPDRHKWALGYTKRIMPFFPHGQAAKQGTAPDLRRDPGPLSVPAYSLPDVVKMDLGAVKDLLTGAGKRRGYIRPMPTFTLAGVSYDYLRPAFEGDHEDIHSWEYGQWPRVEAAIPLTNGVTVKVYAEAMRWTHHTVLVRWRDDGGHHHDAWVPTPNVRRLTASEWDIIEYHLAPPELRPVRWGNRLPGFLPE